jgi:hypothetical protein
MMDHRLKCRLAKVILFVEWSVSAPRPLWLRFWGSDPFPMNPAPSYPPPPYYGTPPALPNLGQPSPSYQHEYQRGGPAGCVYGCTGE